MLAQRLEAGASVMSDDRFCWDYKKPEAQRLGPVTLAPPLWTLTKRGDRATAHVKTLDGVGLELARPGLSPSFGGGSGYLAPRCRITPLCNGCDLVEGLREWRTAQVRSTVELPSPAIVAEPLDARILWRAISRR